MQLHLDYWKYFFGCGMAQVAGMCSIRRLTVEYYRSVDDVHGDNFVSLEDTVEDACEYEGSPFERFHCSFSFILVVGKNG